MRERTLLIQRAVSLGQEKDTKTTAHRTVRLLAPLREDLLAWRLRSARPSEASLVFPGPEGGLWTKTTYDNWRKRAFDRARQAIGLEHARPYDLRHSFASSLPSSDLLTSWNSTNATAIIGTITITAKKRRSLPRKEGWMMAMADRP